MQSRTSKAQLAGSKVVAQSALRRSLFAELELDAPDLLNKLLIYYNMKWSTRLASDTPFPPALYNASNRQ